MILRRKHGRGKTPAIVVRSARRQVRPWLAAVAAGVVALACTWLGRGYWLDPVLGWCRGAVSSDLRDPLRDPGSTVHLIEKNRELRNALAAAQRGTGMERKATLMSGY